MRLVFAKVLRGTRTVDPASVAVAVRVQTEDLISDPSAALPRRVQPDGVVAVARLLVVATSTSWSPACTEAGTTTVADVVWASRAAPPRNATAEAGGSVVVTSAVSVSEAPSSSVTVRVTVQVPAAS